MNVIDVDLIYLNNKETIQNGSLIRHKICLEHHSKFQGSAGQKHHSPSLSLFPLGDHRNHQSTLSTFAMHMLGCA